MKLAVAGVGAVGLMMWLRWRGRDQVNAKARNRRVIKEFQVKTGNGDDHVLEFEVVHYIPDNQIERVAKEMSKAYSRSPGFCFLYENDTELLSKYFSFNMRLCNRMRVIRAITPKGSDRVIGTFCVYDSVFDKASKWDLFWSGYMWKGVWLGWESERRFESVLEYFQQFQDRALGKERFLYLQRVFVAKEWQGKGLGGAILRLATEEAREKQLPMFLLTQDKANFYENAGFKIVDRGVHPGMQVETVFMLFRPPNDTRSHN